MGSVMDLESLFARFEAEFELDFPADAETTMTRVRDVREFVRRAYARQGIEISAGAVFERLRCVLALVVRGGADEVRPESALMDILARKRPAA